MQLSWESSAFKVDTRDFKPARLRSRFTTSFRRLVTFSLPVSGVSEKMICAMKRRKKATAVQCSLCCGEGRSAATVFASVLAFSTFSPFFLRIHVLLRGTGGGRRCSERRSRSCELCFAGALVLHVSQKESTSANLLIHRILGARQQFKTEKLAVLRRLRQMQTAKNGAVSSS